MYHSFINCFVLILGAGEKSSPQETKVSVSLSANITNMCVPSQIVIVTPLGILCFRYFQELHPLRYKKPKFYLNVFLLAVSCCI